MAFLYNLKNQNILFCLIEKGSNRITDKTNIILRQLNNTFKFFLFIISYIPTGANINAWGFIKTAIT